MRKGNHPDVSQAASHSGKKIRTHRLFLKGLRPFPQNYNLSNSISESVSLKKPNLTQGNLT